MNRVSIMEAVKIAIRIGKYASGNACRSKPCANGPIGRKMPTAMMPAVIVSRGADARLCTNRICDDHPAADPQPGRSTAIDRRNNGPYIEETLSVLGDLMRAGKVRAIGTSTCPAADIVEAQGIAERRGLARFRIEQQPYSILNREIERSVLPMCQQYGIGVSAWSPLAKGLSHRAIPQGAAAA